MERNNLDREFKDKLDKRVIEPSGMAWDRLDAMLTVAEEKQTETKPDRNWLYIAAGFIGFLLAATVFFKYTQDTNSNPVDNSIVIKDAVPEIKGTSEDLPGIPEKIVITPQQTALKADAFANVASKQNKVRSTSIKPAVINNSKAAIEIPEIAIEPIAESGNPGVEADNLLAQVANTDIKPGKKTIKVDAGKLLYSVEHELDNNYRNKTLQTIVKNYQVVRSVVANRNHQ